MAHDDLSFHKMTGGDLRKLVRGMIGAAVIFACGYIIIKANADNGVQLKTSAQMAEEQNFRDAVRMVNTLKQSLHNPDSFKLVTAIRMSDGTLCVTCRARNAFNAIITKSIALNLATWPLPRDWDESCRGRGTDLSHVGAAI